MPASRSEAGIRSKEKNAKVLVAGTAGFIGSHLAHRLLNRGDEVIGVDNVNDYYDVNLKEANS